MKKSEIETNIKEIFKSIQGEGPYIGFEQIFIRFCKCNLHCDYCDTDYKTNIKSYSIREIISEIESLNPKNIHSISLTGGEPLLDTEFLKEFLPKVDKKIYLETNGTLPNELKEIIDLIDIVSMDIKLASSAKVEDLTEKHKEFIKIAIKNKKEIFLKVVFDANVNDKEIKTCIDLAKENNLQIILQPLMLKDKMKPTSEEIIQIFDKFIQKYENVRIIPQVHKFLQVE